jgi:ethanolamine utilization protein EutP (predicted NTPase)
MVKNWVMTKIFNKKSGSFKMNMIEKDEVRELVDMVSNIQIGMITKLNIATNVVKTSDWWLDSGATVHVCNNKA